MNLDKNGKNWDSAFPITDLKDHVTPYENSFFPPTLQLWGWGGGGEQTSKCLVIMEQNVKLWVSFQ